MATNASQSNKCCHRKLYGVADLTIPVNPPAEWFQPPAQGIPTDKRITIEASGRVYGYVALWDTCHVGMGGCTKPPKGSPTDYNYAHQGETLTADGSMIRTAVIAGGTGHPGQDVAVPVPDFYANSGKQLMRVRYGEDANGLYFAGALWPEATDLEVAQIRASAVSGDWRFHAAWRHTPSGGYDFAGSILVNIPGYPMPNGYDAGSVAGRMRAIAASAGEGWILSEGDLYISSDEQPIVAGATPFVETAKAPMGTAWHKPTGISGKADLRKIYAWVDPNGNPDAASSYKLPHHNANGSVVWHGVVAAMARLMQSNTQIPESDRKAVYNHLAGHYRQFQKEPPKFGVKGSKSTPADPPKSKRPVYASGENVMSGIENECTDCTDTQLPAGVTQEQILAAVGDALASIVADATPEVDPRDALIASLTDQISALNKRFENQDADELIGQLTAE